MSAMAESEDSVDALPQNATRCLILGIDGHGAEHVYDPTRGRVVALDRDGIHAQYDIEPEQKGEWMAYVEFQRGWRKMQWLGWRLGDVLFGGE